jgi:membrane protease YdiL (CAAX protease family)
VIDCTPEGEDAPPASNALRFTLTSNRFQPFVFGCWKFAFVVGGAVSFALTLSVVLPLMPLEVAVIVEVPLPTPVAKPVWVIVAALPLLLVQSTAEEGV